MVPLPRKPDGPQMPSPPWLHHGLPLERLGRPLPHHPPLLRFWLISILSYVSNSWEQFAMNKDLAINHLVFWKWPHQWQFSQEHGVFEHMYKVTVTSRLNLYSNHHTTFHFGSGSRKEEHKIENRKIGEKYSNSLPCVCWKVTNVFSWKTPPSAQVHSSSDPRTGRRNTNLSFLSIWPQDWAT